MAPDGPLHATDSTGRVSAAWWQPVECTVQTKTHFAVRSSGGSRSSSAAGRPAGTNYCGTRLD